MNTNFSESNRITSDKNSSQSHHLVIDPIINQPLVSIIVPVYNVEEFLEDCIKSLITQTYKHLEVILINDGSTDASLEICEKYSNNEPRVKLVNQANCGVSVARNTGLEVASGELILYIDSDDFISYNTLEILVKNLVKNNSDICIFDRLFWYYSKNRKKQFKLAAGYSKSHLKEVLLVDDIHLYSPCTKLYKRSLLKDIEFPAGLLHEDVFHWIAVMAKNPKISLSSGSEYFYRKNDTSITRIGNNMEKRRVDLSKSFKQGVDFALRNKVSDDFKLCLLNAFFLFFPSPSPISINNEKYIVDKLFSAIPACKKLSYRKSKLVADYHYLFRGLYSDKKLLRINLFPNYRKYIFEFSFKIAGSYTFQLVVGRAN